MKKILFILISGIFTITSCTNMLDLYPISSSTKENSYTKPEDFTQLLNSVYAFLQSNGQYGQNFHFLMEVPSDNSKETSATVRGGVYYQFEILQVATDNSIIEASWTDCYKAIQSCNILLERIDNIAMDEPLKTITIGETYFLRALNYFNLVRLFGDVPLILTETKDPADLLSVGRENKSKVYEQVIIDLKEAIKRLPAIQEEKGRATIGAAYTLLGKVYLTLKQYQEAVEALHNVKGYALVKNYSQIFGPDNEYNEESIFEVNFTSNLENEGSALANLFAPTGEPLDVAAYLQETARLGKALKAVGGLDVWDTQTHFMLVQLRMGKASALKEYLAGEHGILIRDASNFAGLDERFFRIATQTPEENDRLVAAIEEFMAG